MEYIYGLDISLSSYGFAIADEDYNIVDIGTITTHSRQKTESRLSIIWEKLLELTQLYKPKIAVMERGFSRFNTATQQLYRVHGITNLCFKKTEQIYITPKTLKKAICGRGDVKKIYVIKKVKDMYPNLKITTNDEADALSLIYYHKTYVERM